jgi:hypothetical protein
LKKVNLNLLVLLTILLYGCQSNTLSFIGEGEDWSAEVIVQHYSGKESEDIIIHYQGEDIDSVDSFNYLIEAPSWGTGQGSAVLNKAGVFKDEGVSLNERRTSSDAELTITIEWNGKTETFILKNNN